MYHTNKVINTKAGDNNLMSCLLVDDNHNPIDISNLQINSQMRDVNKQLCGEIIINIANAPQGAFFMTIPNYIARGIYFADVQFIDENGVIRHSDIFRINIKETVTWQH